MSGFSELLDLLQILVKAGQAAAAFSDNETAQKVARLADGLIQDARTGQEIDPVIASRVRAIGDALDARPDDTPLSRAEWEKQAEETRAAVARWNAAG